MVSSDQVHDQLSLRAWSAGGPRAWSAKGSRAWSAGGPRAWSAESTYMIS
jgi:hypothetical protein